MDAPKSKKLADCNVTEKDKFIIFDKSSVAPIILMPIILLLIANLFGLQAGKHLSQYFAVASILIAFVGAAYGWIGHYSLILPKIKYVMISAVVSGVLSLMSVFLK